jgi:hypothetical protein
MSAEGAEEGSQGWSTKRSGVRNPWITAQEISSPERAIDILVKTDSRSKSLPLRNAADNHGFLSPFQGSNVSCVGSRGGEKRAAPD